MEDFSFLSDSDDDSTAIEELISQAKDLSVLEQISAINCSSLTTLPTDLDTRFRKLKSFPVATNKTPHHHHSTQNQNQFFSLSKQHNPDTVEYTDRKEGTKFINSSDQNAVSSRSEGTPPDPKHDSSKLKLKSKSGPIIISPTNSSNSSNASLGFTYSKEKSGKRVSISSSPPVKRGCFWCSPKSLLNKKKKDDEDDGQEILSGLTKEQNSVIQKAMKEEEKIGREVDKIVTWAKQALSRMIDFDLQEDRLSDDDGDVVNDDDDDEYDVFK